MTKLTRLDNESGAFANYKLAFTRVSAISILFISSVAIISIKMSILPSPVLKNW